MLKIFSISILFTRLQNSFRIKVIPRRKLFRYMDLIVRRPSSVCENESEINYMLHVTCFSVKFLNFICLIFLMP